MAEVVVRLGGAADVPALTELRALWSREQYGAIADPTFADRFADWWDRQGGQRLTWLAEVDGQPVGMLVVAVFERMPRPGQAPRRWGYLGNAFVLGAYRNFGVGRRLLDAAVEHAQTERFARLLLAPSERSVPFYRRAGFVPANDLMLLPLSDAYPADLGLLPTQREES